jgi:hypothetical protein
LGWRLFLTTFGVDFEGAKYGCEALRGEYVVQHHRR